MIPETIDLTAPKASVLAVADSDHELSLADISLATKLGPTEVRQVVTDLIEARLMTSSDRGLRLTREGVSVRQRLRKGLIRPLAAERQERSYEEVSAALDAELEKLDR